MNTPAEPLPTWDDLEGAGKLDGLVWVYIAPADACTVGRALNGHEYRSLAELRDVLPEYGHANPRCEHPPSCACTAMPARPIS